jgi:Secretion system C-terminal sorting domain
VKIQLLLLALICAIAINSPAHAINIAPEQLWLTSDDVPVYITYASSMDIEDNQLPQIDRAIIALHHGGRDALATYSVVSQAVQGSQASDHVLTVCPQLLKPDQVVAHPQLLPGILAWEDEWFYNGFSVNPNLPPTRSFVTVDSLAETIMLACPNLEVLVFSGHAGGAKFVNRHAMVSTLAENHPEIEILYHFGNSGGYAYLTEERFDLDAGEFLTPASGLDTTGCGKYDYWPFGLSNVVDAQNLRDRYENQNIAMMIGMQDTTIRGLNCQMLFQTPDQSRLQMANLFWEHTSNVYADTPPNHLFFPIPSFGHIVSDFYQNMSSRHILINLLQDHAIHTQLSNDPPIVPAEGGELELLVRFFNSSNEELNVDAWTEITLPNNNTISPIQNVQISIPAGSWVRSPVGFTQPIPVSAPGGIYTHTTKMGVFPNSVVARYSFGFAKVPDATSDLSVADDPDIAHWQTSPDVQEGFLVSSDDPVPSEYVFHPIYPNPFNSSATILISLPKAAELRVTVFNTLGERVSVLADGQSAIGTHRFVLEGSGLSSGLYFVHANVSGRWNEVKKVVLIQ